MNIDINAKVSERLPYCVPPGTQIAECKPCRDHEGPSAYLLLATFDVTASSSELAEKELLGEA